MRLARQPVPTILVLALLAAPLAVEAQQTGRVWRLGILQTSAPRDEAARANEVIQ